jgi:hypothetical protein
MKSKRHLVSFLLVSACLLLTTLSNRGYQLVFSETQNQTVPTRTPTPPPEQPTEPPDDGEEEEPTAVPPTLTPEATATSAATATSLVVTVAVTPVGGFRPTSIPCGNQPTVQARNTINVRRGPGADYDSIGSLLYLEVRPIVGRAADAAWWQIEWDDGLSGWVSDSVVVVQGYIAIVPVVPAPPINGHTPTPGTAWQPTPLPFCTVTPTATATATIQPTATGTATRIATVATTSPSASPTPTATSVIPTATPTATSEDQSVAEANVVGTPQPTAAPLEVAPPASTPNFLPWAGLILLAAVIVVVLTRRRTQA